jgi:hypothetical protein
MLSNYLVEALRKNGVVIYLWLLINKRTYMVHIEVAKLLCIFCKEHVHATVHILDIIIHLRSNLTYNCSVYFTKNTN